MAFFDKLRKSVMVTPVAGQKETFTFADLPKTTISHQPPLRGPSKPIPGYEKGMVGDRL